VPRRPPPSPAGHSFVKTPQVLNADEPVTQITAAWRIWLAACLYATARVNCLRGAGMHWFAEDWCLGSRARLVRARLRDLRSEQVSQSAIESLDIRFGWRAAGQSRVAAEAAVAVAATDARQPWHPCAPSASPAPHGWRLPWRPRSRLPWRPRSRLSCRWWTLRNAAADSRLRQPCRAGGRRLNRASKTGGRPSACEQKGPRCRAGPWIEYASRWTFHVAAVGRVDTASVALTSTQRVRV